jgi:hypothetical protein
VESQHRIPHDDWADQDLLTKSEAAERLSTEIAEVTAKLSAGGERSAAERELMERRLSGLIEAHRRYTEGN